jgi:hypothetical protein
MFFSVMAIEVFSRIECVSADLTNHISVATLFNSKVEDICLNKADNIQN